MRKFWRMTLFAVKWGLLEGFVLSVVVFGMIILFSILMPDLQKEDGIAILFMSITPGFLIFWYMDRQFKAKRKELFYD